MIQMDFLMPMVTSWVIHLDFLMEIQIETLMETQKAIRSDSLTVILKATHLEILMHSDSTMVTRLETLMDSHSLMD